MIPTSAAAVQNRARSSEPGAAPGTAAPALPPLLLPCKPAWLPNLSPQDFSKSPRVFSPLREPRMMLRLCNANRCGVYNPSCPSPGGARWSSTRALLAMGCSGVARKAKPGKTPAAGVGMVPRESPPSRGGAALDSRSAALGFPSVRTQVKFVLPSQESIFLLLEGKKKKSHLQGSGGAGIACGVPWLSAVLLQCLWGCCSPGISRIHPSSLPARRCLCAITENLHYCAFWCCADTWLGCEHHHNAALVAALSEIGQCLCCARDRGRKLLAQKGFFRSLTREISNWAARGKPKALRNQLELDLFVLAELYNSAHSKPRTCYACREKVTPSLDLSGEHHWEF